MDIKKAKWVPDSQGSAASEDAGDYVSRACSYQYGANVKSLEIDKESQEQNLRFGVPDSETRGTHLPEPDVTQENATRTGPLVNGGK